MQIDPFILQIIIITVYSAIFFAAIPFLFWYNRKIILKPIQEITKKQLIALMIIVVIFLLNCLIFGLTFKSFNPADEEWKILVDTRNIVEGSEHIMNNKYGITYQLILFHFYKIIGITIFSTLLVSLIISVLFIILFYLIMSHLLKNLNFSILGTFLFSLSPLFFLFSALLSF